MNSDLQVEVAAIDCAFNRGAALDWVVSGAPPFQAINLFDIEQTTIDRIWDLYTKAYGGYSTNLFFRNVFSYQNYARWILFFNDAKNLDAFAFFKKHPNGIKLGIVSADFANTAAKSAVIDFLRLVFNIEGVFGEVSDRIEIRLKGHVPIVDPKIAAMILIPKIITIDPNGTHYSRDLKHVGIVKKMMVGRPVNVP